MKPAGPRRKRRLAEVPKDLAKAVSERNQKTAEDASSANAESSSSQEKAPEPAPDSPDPNCSICLGRMENKSFTDGCFHTFCFVCLSEWSKVKAVCPLCKQPFKSIIHNVRSIEDYDQYHVQPPEENNPYDPRTVGARRFRYRTTVTTERWWDLQHQEHMRQLELLQRPTRTTTSFNWRRYRQAATSNFRRRVYANGMRMREMRTERGRSIRFRDISADFFHRNPACCHRLVPWLNRELNVLLRSQEDHVQFVLELILDLIKRFEIQSEEFFQHIESFIGSRTEHFVHEFYNFARSPYDMVKYDQLAVYDDGVAEDPANIHTIEESDSEREETRNDPDVVMVTPEESNPPAPNVRQETSDHNYLPTSTLNSWEPLLGRVRNLLPYMRWCTTSSSGWDSPPPGTSSSIWALPEANPPRVSSPIPGPSSSTSDVINQIPLDLSAGPAMSAGGQAPASPASVSSHDSDVILIHAEKPWADRSPILLSSGSEMEDIEIQVVSKESKPEPRRSRSRSHREVRARPHQSEKSRRRRYWDEYRVCYRHGQKRCEKCSRREKREERRQARNKVAASDAYGVAHRGPSLEASSNRKLKSVVQVPSSSSVEGTFSRREELPSSRSVSCDQSTSNSKRSRSSSVEVVYERSVSRSRHHKKHKKHKHKHHRKHKSSRRRTSSGDSASDTTSYRSEAPSSKVDDKDCRFKKHSSGHKNSSSRRERESSSGERRLDVLKEIEEFVRSQNHKKHNSDQKKSSEGTSPKDPPKSVSDVQKEIEDYVQLLSGGTNGETGVGSSSQSDVNQQLNPFSANYDEDLEAILGTITGSMQEVPPPTNGSAAEDSINTKPRNVVARTKDILMGQANALSDPASDLLNFQLPSSKKTADALDALPSTSHFQFSSDEELDLVSDKLKDNKPATIDSSSTAGPSEDADKPNSS